MTSSYRIRLSLHLVLGWMACVISSAEAGEIQATLSHQVAMDTALGLAQEATHSHTYSTTAVRFDQSVHEWIVGIDVLLDSGGVKSSVATINESTGLACLRLPPATDCAAHTNIHFQLANARAKLESDAMAREELEPNLQSLAEALLRYQYGTKRPGNNASPHRYFVSVASFDIPKLVDLAPDVVGRLRRDGVQTYAVGRWRPEGESGDTKVSIGLPARRPDGSYNVPFTYDCGGLCAGWLTAVVRREETGWHVVSTVANAMP